MTYVKKCPECGSLHLTIDKERGEITCRACGLVVEEKIIDFDQEWREFESEQGEKRRRAGAPMTWSVDFNEPIVIRENKKIKIVKIGKFVDTLLAERNSFIKKEGNIEYAPVTEFECVAFDKDNNIAFRKVSEVSRHPAEEVYEVTLETGKRVKVTGNHSIFTLENNEIKPVKVDNLVKGQFIVTPKELPLVEDIKDINVLDEFIIIAKKYPLLYLRNFSDEKLFNKLRVLEKTNEVLKGKVKNWIRHKTIPLWVLNEFAREVNIYDYTLDNCKIGIYSGRSELPLKLDLNKDFIRILGLFAAEGTVNENNIVFSFGRHEKDYIHEVVKGITGLFGVSYNLFDNEERSSIQIQFNSKLLSILFKEILKTGSNAHTKRISEIIYSIDKSLKKEFITAYLNGDGSNVITLHEGFRPEVCLSTNSVSEELTNDFLLLYSQLGIHANYQEAFIKGRIMEKTGKFISDTTSRRAYIKNPDTVFELGFLNQEPSEIKGKGPVETLVPAPQEYRKEWKSRKRARISRNEALKIAEKYGDEKLRKVAEAPFLYLRVKSIKKVKSTSGYAYDLTVPGYENFVGGRGGIFLHNTKFDRGLGTDVGQRQDLYKLSGKEKNKFFRLRKWQYRISTAIERNLKLALAELKRVGSYLKLPKSVEEEAARVYTLAVQRGLVRGRSMESVVAGALYAACRRHEVPRTLDELSEASGIDKKEIGRTYRFITRELGIRILPSNPVDYLARFASSLKLNAETQSKAVDILEQAQNSELTSGRGPTGIAAASLYVAALINNEKRTQREVADVAGVTEVTIRNRYKELIRKLNLMDKIKKNKKRLLA